VDAPVVLLSDLTDPRGVDDLFQQIDSRGISLDVLVNCVGVLVSHPLDNTTREDWLNLLTLNTVVPALVMSQARRRGAHHMIHLLDIAWNQSWKHHAAYVASKSALAAVCRVAAVEYAPECRVNAIAPGLISSPAGTQGRYSGVEQRIPMGRRGTASEVAAALEMLLDAPDYMTGQIITVDGGLSLR
jgi:3-oxoacyl-[acyl-carrier protein] reductase/pteridine reductase